MIVVVEGPSAAGKTTWARTHRPARVVPEGVHHPPDGVVASADFWTEVHAERWRAALELERASGLAVCDTDPFKLHYTWCKWMIGEESREVWLAHRALHRRALREHRLGFADLVLCEIPDPDELLRRKEGDPHRRRRNFSLHARLAEPLRCWYRALDAVEPGRVQWQFPIDDASWRHTPVRHNRYALDFFDSLLDALPTP